MKENINYVNGLNQAWKAHRDYNTVNRKGKASIVKQLGLVPFLTISDIHYITGASIPYIKKHGEPAEGWFESQLLVYGARWDADQLDALLIIAAAWMDGVEAVPSKLVYNTLVSGVPLVAMSRLTGVPLAKLRAAVHAQR